MSRLTDAQSYHAMCMEQMKSRPVPNKQKFQPGARVRIADDLGPAMSHFPAGRTAVVRYTYAHAFGGANVKSYCLDVDGIGEVSWYEEHQLTLVPETVA